MRTLTPTLRSPSLHLILIAAAVIAVYANTFSVPFHFDDKLNIADNSRIKDLSFCWPPSGVRWFGNLTFALNYRMNGLDPAGYHAVNLAVHVAASLLVYWLVLLTFETPYFRFGGVPPSWTDRDREFALAAALLFGVHPIQTQAVTYIVQRFASLAALCYLLSLCTYAKARLLGSAGRDAPGAGTKAVRAGLYVVSLTAALLAMKTKETAFTLPIVILAYELSFLRTGAPDAPVRGRWQTGLLLLPFALTLLIIPLSMMRQDAGAFRGTYDISRTDYLLTQFPVIATYLRLLLFPVAQSIDYDIPVHHRFLDSGVLLPFLLLAAVAFGGALLALRSRSSRGPERLAAFGLFWFFVTLSVESSIIPLPDVIFEHRLYLPSVGFILAAVTGGAACASWLAGRFPGAGRIAGAAAAAAVLALAVAAHERNVVWGSETALWEDAVSKHPGAYRAHSMLGTLYKSMGRRDEARECLLRALTIKPDYSEARVNLGSIYVEEGRLDEAMREFMLAAQAQNMDEIDSGYLLLNIGNVYRIRGMYDKEIEYYTYALALIPGDAMVHFRLGSAYLSKGMTARAEESFRTAHQLNPDRF